MAHKTVAVDLIGIYTKTMLRRKNGYQMKYTNMSPKKENMQSGKLETKLMGHFKNV
jgi:hypothetical protein